MTVAVVDSGGANIASMLHALRRLGVEPEFTSDHHVIRHADRVILPGVGAAHGAMDTLRENQLVSVIRELNQPVLGVCLGMQLLFDFSEEGDTGLLGVIPGRVVRFPRKENLRVPHMGWNTICSVSNYTRDLFEDYEWFYYVHSYYAPVCAQTLATTNHGLPFSAVVRHRNFLGAQFHPERSSAAGAKFLSAFLQGEDSWN